MLLLMTLASSAQTLLLQRHAPQISSNVLLPNSVLIEVRSVTMTVTVVMAPTRQMHFVNHTNGVFLVLKLESSVGYFVLFHLLLLALFLFRFIL